nr:RNA polymerase sigma factor sigE, chloroplastic/mitochondrial [Tanacetum cinerariifolium]
MTTTQLPPQPTPPITTTSSPPCNHHHHLITASPKETKRTVYGDVVFINTKRILTVAGGCGAWRVVVMERVMVSAVDSGEDVGGAGGWLVAGFVDLPEKCAAPEELAGRWEAPDVFTVRGINRDTSNHKVKYPFLHKVLEREPTNGELAAATNMNVSQLRKQVRIGQED